MIHLQKAYRGVVLEFINGPAWRDVKECLKARMPVSPDPLEPSHVSAARGHQRAGFEKAIDAIEKMPLEFDQDKADPFARPAVAITED